MPKRTPLTVKQLIDRLQSLPGDSPVVAEGYMAIDADGVVAVRQNWGYDNLENKSVLLTVLELEAKID